MKRYLLIFSMMMWGSSVCAGKISEEEKQPMQDFSKAHRTLWARFHRIEYLAGASKLIKEYPPELKPVQNASECKEYRISEAERVMLIQKEVCTILEGLDALEKHLPDVEIYSLARAVFVYELYYGRPDYTDKLHPKRFEFFNRVLP